MLLLLFPFLGFVLLFATQKRINVWAGWIAAAITLIGLIVSIAIGFDKAIEQGISWRWHWLQWAGYSLDFIFVVDRLAWAMLILVHFVALLVQIYSVSYMQHEASLWRYFAFLQLFVFSMLGIVLAGNLIVMYVFWELVGLSSYLLIGFWHEKPRAVWAAKKAFLLNRVGDIGFLAGILLLWTLSPALLQFDQLLTPHSLFTSHFSLLTIIGLLLFCGTIGKSAQFPLSAWLPDAMEGPTPVSALIHAATMVAAGVYLLARIHPLLTDEALLVIAIVGTVTMVTAAYKALFQTDIKKMLAYSTISQLGLMVMAMGINAREASLFHLFTHAFFKAGLFLGAGVVLHHLSPTPSLRDTPPQLGGGLRTHLPLTFWTYTLCAAALVGLPLTSGFLSKDLILIRAFEWAQGHGGLYYLIPVLSVLSVGLTAAYMARQWRSVFLGSSQKGTKIVKTSLDEPTLPHHPTPIAQRVPLVVLAGLSVFIWFSWNPLSAEDGVFWAFLQTKPLFKMHSDFHVLVPLSAVLMTVLGGTLGYWSGQAEMRFIQRLKMVYQSIKAVFDAQWKHIKHWLLILRPHDEAQSHVLFLIVPLQRIAHWVSVFDQRIIDIVVNGLGYLTVILAHIVGRIDRMLVDGVVNGLAWTAGFAGNRTRNLQNGRIQSYFVVMLIGILALIFLFLV